MGVTCASGVGSCGISIVCCCSVYLLVPVLAMSCIDDIPPNPQDGRTPLMLAAGAGHLPVARLLVEAYHCDVNEEDGEVSGWEVMGGVSEYSTCVIMLDPLHMDHFIVDQDMFFAYSECKHG